MGYRYDQHSDMCGCSRCALEWDSENPRPVFDKVPDPDYRDDGTHLSEPSLDDDMDDYDPYDDESEEQADWMTYDD